MAEIQEEDWDAISTSSSESADSYSLEDTYEIDQDEHIEQDHANTGLSSLSVEDRKLKNVDALLRGNIVVKRQSLLPRLLSVSEGASICRKPFKLPCSNGNSECNNQNEELARRLWARKKFVPWGSSRPLLVALPKRLEITPDTLDLNESFDEEVVDLPPEIEPLVLWQPEQQDSTDDDGTLSPIIVDPLLVRFLRPHQREGVQFMFDCVSGLSNPSGINGCILADDMGLGKTLQSITLLYTLLRQGFDGTPMVKKAIIVTPTSLVSNWEAELEKWLGRRVRLVALCESTREDVVSGILSFTNPSSNCQVLIVSYETFRLHAEKFSRPESCDLLICDEAHRLKNDQTLTNRALASLSCKRRILLSGTPMQNDLEEFFAMVNFTNPGILGDAAHFRKYFEIPIICGREHNADAEAKRLSQERAKELSTHVNQFILRRTNTLLSNHLPPKIIEVVCCKLSHLQADLYNHFIHSKGVKRVITEETKQSKILAYITLLKKLCNHPKLIYDTIKSGSPGTSGFENCLSLFPPSMFSGRCGSWSGGDGSWVELSGKMHVLARLLAHLRQKTDDRIVLVSNYTQTLDLFAQICRERRYPHLRLDGTTSISKRQKLVNRFNDPSKDEFVFLLSSKAGGCGLNLIGGNRLVLFDPDWNPANDKQAAARVWRDGQKKRVYIYRFLSTGTIEEQIFQRQMSKEGLQKVIHKENDGVQGNFLSTEDLRDLFTFNDGTRSKIHDNLSCLCCLTRHENGETLHEASPTEEHSSTTDAIQDIGGFAEVAGCLKLLKNSKIQVGTPLEEDLGSWGHHFHSSSIPDSVLHASAGDEVTFAFTNQISGKLAPVGSETERAVSQDKSRPINDKENINLVNSEVKTEKSSELSAHNGRSSNMWLSKSVRNPLRLKRLRTIKESADVLNM